MTEIFCKCGHDKSEHDEKGCSFHVNDDYSCPCKEYDPLMQQIESGEIDWKEPEEWDAIARESVLLRAQNARLRAALEKYAAEENWGNHDEDGITPFDVWIYDNCDNGYDIAREALEPNP